MNRNTSKSRATMRLIDDLLAETKPKKQINRSTAAFLTLFSLMLGIIGMRYMAEDKTAPAYNMVSRWSIEELEEMR